MKAVTQRIVGRPNEGDCLAAAVASVLELELDEFAPLISAPESEWWPILEGLLKRRGFKPIGVMNDPPRFAPPGYAIAVGPAPLHRESSHAVVALDGEIVHDPHPNKTGLESIRYWIVFMPIVRTPPRLSPDEIDIGL